VNDQPFARGQLARKLAVDLRDIDEGRALQRAGLGDLHGLAVHGRLHVPLDDEDVAVGNLHALELDVEAHGELASGRFDGRGARGAG
jgi:hypothetical protein